MGSFKQSTYWQIWADCCNLHKAFYGIQEDDTPSWEKAVEAASEAKFAESLTLLVVSELEYRTKSRKGGVSDATKKQKSGTGTGNTPA